MTGPRWLASALALAVVAALMGCASKPQIVQVPVAVPCVANVPARPVLVTDAELRDMTDFQIPIALFRDRELRQAYQAVLEAIVGACAELPARG
jgi:type IV pilus biogenesis protein CpaD/CtpE